MTAGADRLRDNAERAWAWALDTVRWDDAGPWLPESVPMDGGAVAADDEVRDTFYDGIAGLAPALVEIRTTRSWSAAEADLARAIVQRLSACCQTATEPCLYAGIAGHLTALTLLDPATSAPALDRLAALRTPEGWPSTFPDHEMPINDVVLGAAGITLASLFTRTDAGDALARSGCDALLQAAEQPPDGLDWPMAADHREALMPNYSHGPAGVAATLAVAGLRLGEPAYVAAAARGAEHLAGLADLSDGGCKIPVRIPDAPDRDRYAYGWCHGSAGLSLLWTALQLAGVEVVRDRPVEELRSRTLHAALTSGLPERRHPGFWDNDGRCCGTTGVAEAMLDAALCDVGGRGEQWLDFGLRLADVLVDRASPAPGNADQLCWRFREHRQDPPLLDPAVGWMQGAAGISTLLRRAARAREAAAPVGRVGLPDNWWAVPVDKSSSTTHRCAGS
jgi:hypothetical protein